MNSKTSSVAFPWPLAGVIALMELAVVLASVLFSLPWLGLILAPGVVLIGFWWQAARFAGRQAAQTAFETPTTQIKDLETALEAEQAAGRRLEGQIEALNRELALVRFRFTETGEFATRTLAESEQFARGEVQSVLRGFHALESTASSIEAGVTESFQGMMNPENPENLGGIAQQSGTIAAALNEFFSDLDDLDNQTQSYLRSNQGELEKVSVMAAKVEEFFENIRMISLNLSIEASRAGSGPAGKAFQVLAQKLREFSTEAQQISATQRQVVDGAVQVLQDSQTSLRRNFQTLGARIPLLRGQLDPFASIIARAQNTLRAVLGDLAKLSAAVKGLLTNEIGQLQFQDLNRQEHEHLSMFIRWSAGQGTLDASLGPEEARTERLALAQEFNERLTTSNETRVLQAYLESHGIVGLEIKGSARTAGSVELF